MDTDDSQAIFSPATVNQAIANISDLVGLGIDDPESSPKNVIEASYKVLDRRFGKPRETIELSHHVKINIDIPGWDSPVLDGETPKSLPVWPIQ